MTNIVIFKRVTRLWTKIDDTYLQYRLDCIIFQKTTNFICFGKKNGYIKQLMNVSNLVFETEKEQKNFKPNGCGFNR